MKKMEIEKLLRCILLFTCLICAYSSTPLSLNIKHETAYSKSEPVSVELDVNSTGFTCNLTHPGEEKSSDSWISTSNSTVSVVLVYNDTGRYLLQANCFNSDGQNVSKTTYLEIYEIISGLSFNAPKTDDRKYILSVNKRSKTAELQFRLETGNPFTVTAKVNNVTIEGSNIETNITARTGTVTIPQLGIGDVKVEIIAFNQVSSVTSVQNMTAVEPIGDLYLKYVTPSIVNTSVLLAVSVYSGSNIQYEFCFEDLPLLSSFNNCYTTGELAAFNYTFSSIGTSNITVFGSNELEVRNTTRQIELVNKISGFRLSTSQVTASTSDQVTVTLTAPDITHYPMEETMIIYYRDDEIFKQPDYLTLGHGGSQSLAAVLTPPGVILFRAMVFGRLSTENTTVEIRVGDPLNLIMTTSDIPMRSDETFLLTISEAIGWGFDYTLSYEPGDEQRSFPGVIKTMYNESLQFNHTYAQAGTYSLTFNAKNVLYQQEIIREVRVLYPVLPFKIISNPSVSIPDGWATFNIAPTPGTHVPTTASCTIDYGNNTRQVKDVDWVSGFPASYNYKTTGIYHVAISCSNSVSHHTETFTANVNDRDIDIQGLKVAMPEYVLVNTMVIIKLSIEVGSNSKYRVQIGSEYDEVFTNQTSVTHWEMQYYVKETREYTVFVSAYNSVSRIESSGRTSVVKDLKGFTFSVVPHIVSTTDDFKIFVTTPGQTYFPMGPLKIVFYKETELLVSKTVETPIPLTDISITASRWRANQYSVRATVTSPVDQVEFKQFVDVLTPIPFFTFTVDNMITIPDGIVSYGIETRVDETRPTNASCLLTYGDGESEILHWDFSISFNHTFVSTGVYNTTFMCTNRVSERKTLRMFDVCEFTADGFRFLYPNTVPLNSSSPNVNVRFKYNICGLTSATSDSQISWLFEPDSPVEVEPTIDWEEEHVYVGRGSYNIKVFIKSLKTDTETMKTLPLRIGILSLETGKTIGRVSSDEFNIAASGAYGSKVNFFVEFGDGSSFTVNETDLQPSHKTVFRHRYNSDGLFFPRITVWSADYVENITLDKAFLVQPLVEEFDIELEVDSFLLPAPVSITIHLGQDHTHPSISCYVDTGDTTHQTISFNEDVLKYNGFRFTHVYKSYGPYDIIVNCSNLVSFKTLTGAIQLKTNFSPGPNITKLLVVSLSVFVLFTVLEF